MSTYLFLNLAESVTSIATVW